VLEDAARRELFQLREPPLEPQPYFVLEVIVEREPRRHVEIREVILLEREIDVASLGDPDGPRERRRVIGKTAAISRPVFR